MDDVTPCPNRFAGKTALVTGSTDGIGRGVARRLLREGASVVLNDEGGTGVDGDALAASLETDVPGSATYLQADVGDADSVRRLVDETIAELGGLDVLVNNVGEGRNARPGELSTDAWEWVMDVTLRSGWLTTRYALEELAGGGSVVNVSSAHGGRTTRGFFPYNVAKAGVEGLTRALAVELGPIGIRVNAVAPGPIVVDSADPSRADVDQPDGTDPLERMGRPADVAGPVAYLASDDAAYLTGAVLPVDGGRSARQHTMPDGR